MPRRRMWLQARGSTEQQPAQCNRPLTRLCLEGRTSRDTRVTGSTAATAAYRFVSGAKSRKICRIFWPRNEPKGGDEKLSVERSMSTTEGTRESNKTGLLRCGERCRSQIHSHRSLASGEVEGGATAP